MVENIGKFGFYNPSVN